MQGPPPRARETDAGARLFNWVDEVLRTNGAKAAERLRKHEPHVMAAYMVVSAVEEARGETEELARTRAGPAWDVIKQLRLHTGISGVYNRLGKSEESQRLVVNMLLEKVRARGRGPFHSPSTHSHGHTHAHLWFDVFDSLQVVQAAEVSAAPQVLRFALCTVASELLAVAESENFIMTDHANPLQLARVAVGLCRAKPELAEILRAEFYRTCPLTVPRQPEPGLAGPAVLENMGFKDKESREDWLARMNRVLCTYAVLVAQPEGAPVGMADGWAWLANMVNACSRVPEPHFFTADALEIFLGVTAPSLLRAYGQPFLQLLQVVQADVLPKLVAGDAKARLAELLDVALRSGGRRLKPFFVQS